MVSEQEMIDSDYDDLSDSDIIVLLIVDEKRPVLKTRLQKISLLYHELYEKPTEGTDHNAYFFGGYSDDIDESAVNLADMGILEESKNGYTLTDYGRKLRQFILDEYDDEEQIKDIENIKKAIETIPDKNLVGLTYHFYNETARNSTIADSVRKLNDASSYDGIPLSKYSKGDFESKLRSGTPIRRGS